MTGDLEHALNQLSAARKEIKNLRQQIISMKHSHKKDIGKIKEVIDSWTCVKCRANISNVENTEEIQQTNVSNNNDSHEDLQFQIIGYIETGFSNKRGLARQSGILSQSQGILHLDNTVFTNPDHALVGLEQFSHMWIIFHFHANRNTHIRAKVAPPRLNGVRTGVFATRSPHRPTPIGLSLVKIDAIEDDSIFFSGVDMIDGTPVLDIKPYIPQYDLPYPSPLSNFTHSTHSDDATISSIRNLQWERLPRESDGRSEDGDSILQDQSDTDFDFQDRLLVGESSQSTSQSNEATETKSHQAYLPSIRVLDGRDSDDVFLINSQNIISTSVNDNNFFDRSPMRSTSQREAPEGSEGGSLPSPVRISSGNVRIADWITNPPVPQLQIQFSENSSRIIERISESAEAASHLRSSIDAVLSEDPRSVYVRNRHPNEQFTCVIERLIVTCIFDDIMHTCLVTDIKVKD